MRRFDDTEYNERSRSYFNLMTTRTRALDRFPVTQAMIGANLLMALIVLFRGGFENTLTLIAAGADTPSLTLNGQYWRWVSATFLHGSLLHLAFNMFALWQLGRVVERLFGSPKMFIIYMISGIGGSLLSAVAAGDIVSVGASGAVFGMAGAALGMGARHRDQVTPAFKSYLAQGILPIVVYNFFLGLAMPGMNINNWAHAGGFVAGFASGFLIYPDSAYWTPRTHPAVWVTCGVAGAILAGAAAFALPGALNPSLAFASLPLKRVTEYNGAISYSVPYGWLRSVTPAFGESTETTYHSRASEGRLTINFTRTNFGRAQAMEVLGGIKTELQQGKHAKIAPSEETVQGMPALRANYVTDGGEAAVRVSSIWIAADGWLASVRFSAPTAEWYFYRELATKLIRSIRLDPRAALRSQDSETTR